MNPRWIVLTAAFALSCAGAVSAQQSAQDERTVGAGPPRADDARPTPDEQPAMTLREMERELRRIRARHFRGIRNQEIRQIGIRKLRVFNDPIVFDSMLEIFRREDDDARAAVLDHFLDQGTEEGNVTLGWAAVFDRDEWIREAALERIKKINENGEIPRSVQSVVAQGLRSGKERELAAAANAAASLRLYDAIPMLINAQIGAGPASGRSSDRAGGALAYIVVGTQQAFISDLTPVVGAGAVGFDPTLSVITSGTVMQVNDAIVYTYRLDVHYALTRLASAGWGGQPTAHLGFDNAAWVRWYKEEFLPYRERAERQQADSGGG